MSKYNHCYLCASDDGILLDVTGERGRAICGKIETCLSVKVDESDAPSIKICHKCSYELDACSKFVQKYSQARDATLSKSNPAKGHCSLCSEPGRKGYIFDCRDGSSIDNLLYKIQEIFNDNIFRDKRKSLHICLDCRYHLDVLFDLKCIYQTTPGKLRSLNKKGLELSELPKTKTRVVSRKTTYIRSPRLNGTEVSDTDSSSTTSTMPMTRKRGRPRKDSFSGGRLSAFRTCQQCNTSVECTIDMYKYHRTGLTVCKECWLAMDPEKLTQNKRAKLGLTSSEVGTRRCAIILKDVLTNPAKYDNFYKVEKDEHGNTTFIVTDDSSENEEKEKIPAKRSRRSFDVVATVASTPAKKVKPLKRQASRKSSDHEDEPPEKIKDKGKKIEVEPPEKIKDKGKKIEVEPPEKIKDKGKKIEVEPPEKIKDKGKKIEVEPPEKIKDKGKKIDVEPPEKIKDKGKKIEVEPPEKIKDKGKKIEVEPPEKMRGKGKKVEEEPPENIKETGKKVEDEPPEKMRRKGKKVTDEPPEKIKGKGKKVEDEPPEKIKGNGKKFEDEPTEKIRGRGKNFEDESPVKIVDEKPSTSASTRKRNGVAAASDTEVVVTRATRSRGRKDAKAASDPDLPRPKLNTRVQRAKLVKPDPADSTSNDTKQTPRARKSAAKTAATVVATSEETAEPLKRTRSNSLTSQDKISPSSRPNTTTRRLKSVSEVVSPPKKSTRSKSKPKSKSVSPKNSGSELELEKSYTCGVCSVEYKNKLIGMKHELTHAKQPEVKLQRVTIPEIIVEDASSGSSLIEEPEEQSHDVSSTSDPRAEEATREKASIDAAETMGTNENSEDRESRGEETDVPLAKVDDECNEEAAKVKDTADKDHTDDHTEDKTDEVEEKTEDKEGEVAEKTEDKADEVEEKTEDKADEVEERTDDKADEVEEKTEDKAGEVEEKTEDKAGEVDKKTEDKAGEVDKKTEDKAGEVDKKTEDKMDEIEDKTENKTSQVEDGTEDKTGKVEDKMDTVEDKTEDKSEATDKNGDEADAKDKDEDKADENDKNTEAAVGKSEDEDRAVANTEDGDEAVAEDKNEENADVNNKTEDKTDALEATDPDATAKDEECLENSVENARVGDTNDKSIITRSDENKDDEEEEKTTAEAAASEKPETMSGDDVEKNIESSGVLKNHSEETSHESTETSANVNGVNVEDDPIAKIDDEANEAEKETLTMDDEEVRNINVNTADKSVEPNEKESDDKEVEEKIVLPADETSENVEDAAEATTIEATDAGEKDTTEDNEESESMASDVLTAVFDLATAEVKKRLENEPPRDGQCTPVSETLENISREINNSADMPSLEPLVDDQSSNNQS